VARDPAPKDSHFRRNSKVCIENSQRPKAQSSYGLSIKEDTWHQISYFESLTLQRVNIVKKLSEMKNI
jgi:hypothetical protein